MGKIEKIDIAIQKHLAKKQTNYSNIVNSGQKVKRQLTATESWSAWD